MNFEIHGNIEGIRESVLAGLNSLYDYPVEEDEYFPREILTPIALVSARINREFSLYFSREGDLLDITVGDTDSVPLQDWHMRRSGGRLSRVRCIHTHPGGSPYLSDVDLSALKSLMLDSMCAVGVDRDGNITGIQCAFLGKKSRDGRETRIIGPMMPRANKQKELTEEIYESERIVDADRDEENESNAEKALLVGIDSEESLDELESLAETAGAQVVGRVLQKKTWPDPVTYLGSGKAQRLQLDAQAAGADLILIDDELSGIQNRNLEDITGVKVVDRTTLILDIFAGRAKTREGKLQVSLAQMKYRASRLIGQGLILSRLGGGIGTRGPGESKLEIDRRRIRERVTELNRELEKLIRERDLRRRNRERSRIPTVALVGYTNAGKSSLLNLLSGADVYVQDQLFATLDSVSRRVVLPDGGEFLLTDTVGFISKLPHDLVDAFRSTLEEATQADVLLIVCDRSNPNMHEQMKVVDEVLLSLGATEQKRICVMNKCDLEPQCDPIPGAVCVSAKSGEGIDELLSEIGKLIREREKEYNVLVPFDRYQLLNELHSLGRVTLENYTDTGTEIKVYLSDENAGRILNRYGSQVFSSPEKQEN